MSDSAASFGPYTVLATLGEGGMATVYLADDARHGRKVAIKVMKPEIAGTITPDRFLREIETVARLTHPHILPLYDSGTDAGRLYYVMPHIAGGSLRGRLDRESRLPVEETVRIAQGIASALGHAHLQGLVHRDIKPANVLLSDGIPLVADFGIARTPVPIISESAQTRALSSPLTAAHVVLGTPQYMAPEQAFGEHPVDGRADIYALACVIYEMLAGQPPFVASTVPALLMRHATETVPPFAPARSDVPPALELVIRQALAKSPADRFATAAEFASALGSAIAAGPHVRTGPVAERSRADVSQDVRIAVLPFQNLGGTADDECLSDGVCDELIHTLGRIEGIRVTARGSSFLFRERRADVRAIGAELNVNHILDGTLRRAGKRLRLTVQLINTADGFQTWSERYDREVDDVFALQDDIAGSVAEVLRVRLVGGAAKAASFEAYERYLAGVQRWNRRTPADLEAGVEELTRAVQIDETFAPAWGALGLSYVTLNLYGLRPPESVMTLARAAVDRALRLDRQQAAALTARATIRAIHDWDQEAAERDFREVIARAPSDALAEQWYATNLLAPLGRFGEARAALTRALVLDPLSPSVVVSAGFVEYLAGEPGDAIALCDRALALDPAFSAAKYFQGPALAAVGRPDDAVRALESAAAGMGRSPESIAALAVVLADSGDRARARDSLFELERETRYVSPALTAMVKSALGDADGAVADLERAIDTRAVEAIWLEVRPSFARLRADARFPGLIARRHAARRLATATGLSL